MNAVNVDSQSSTTSTGSQLQQEEHIDPIEANLLFVALPLDYLSRPFSDSEEKMSAHLCVFCDPPSLPLFFPPLFFTLLFFSSAI